MSDPVLTDKEKGALLEGMSSGEVEVHSSKGSTYADVTEFEIGPRSRLKTNSYPRLQNLNRQFASRMSKQVELLLNVDSTVTFASAANTSYAVASENDGRLSLIVEFLPKPLPGSAFVTLSSATWWKCFTGVTATTRQTTSRNFLRPERLVSPRFSARRY